MFGPAAAALPLSAFLFAGAVVGAVVLVRRVPSHELSVPVGRARRRGTVIAALALVLAVALVVLGTSLPQTSLRRTQLIAVVPLATAAVHAGVLLLGELTWPRPRHRVRSARLAIRSVRQDAPHGMVAVFNASLVLLWGTCVGGTLLASETGRSIVSPAGGSAGPFPGAFYTGPIALATVPVVVLTWAVLLRVPGRPGVPGADTQTDGALRRAAAHRALRVSTCALLGTSSALLVIGGTAAHGLGGASAAVDGVTVWYDPGLGPLWDTLAGGVAIVGGALVLLALAVLLIPARGIRR